MPATMPDILPTDRLADLINAKRDLLEQLRQLARQQNEHIAAGEMSTLINVLAAKEMLLRNLFAVERQIDPFRQEDPEQRIWRNPEARRRCQVVAERCESLLAELMLLEKQSETDLQRRRDETAKRLDLAHSALEARRAYAPHTRPASAQLDLSSEG
jgi:hypothetical protein